MGTPNREPQEYSKNMTEYKDPGRYIPIIYSYYILGVRCLGFPVKSLQDFKQNKKPSSLQSCARAYRVLGLGFRAFRAKGL